MERLLRTTLILSCLLAIFQGLFCNGALTVLVDNDKIGYIGQTELTLYCSYSGGPDTPDTVTIEWHKADDTLESGWHLVARGGDGTGVVHTVTDDDKYELMLATLKILSLDEADTGRYRCSVTVEYPRESAEGALSLNVIDGSNQPQPTTGAEGTSGNQVVDDNGGTARGKPTNILLVFSALLLCRYLL
ncbi:uncharacterized protein LOC100373125 [Saccoglossus kowalevskii]|uniref:Uncharacterized protein LOC100373125 n=1 Tax=Saccoglossus kowalevskii TaxID=10224 RepID=A0ABM0GTY7_SACKO|nr:PREDICTED: uncharacterized protein LOC100373125 [Saccoglossus kowalevskii]